MTEGHVHKNFLEKSFFLTREKRSSQFDQNDVESIKGEKKKKKANLVNEVDQGLGDRGGGVR